MGSLYFVSTDQDGFAEPLTLLPGPGDFMCTGWLTREWEGVPQPWEASRHSERMVCRRKPVTQWVCIKRDLPTPSKAQS